MSVLLVRERLERESDLARAWWRLQPRTRLPLSDGRSYLLLYGGQPGSSVGPDVHDVVLCSPQEEADQLVGDVEFHVRAGDWFVHGHQDDPRYNQVILHVVYYLDNSLPARRQDGGVVPTCSLLDYPRPGLSETGWPCQRDPLTEQEMRSTLLYAGWRRFHAKSQALQRVLVERQVLPGAAWSAYDLCLLPALAEGLGYGRDRAFFRAVGLSLVGLSAPVPNPLGRAPGPAPLDARRLRYLSTLIERWKRAGAWRILRESIEQERDVKAAIAALRAAFRPLSQARTDILVTNIVLPFADAVAGLEHVPSLARRAQRIYLAYPGLVSNRVTRLMSAQLQLSEEPGQACLQQGLHDIYARTCQAKACQNCLCGGKRL